MDTIEVQGGHGMFYRGTGASSGALLEKADQGREEPTRSSGRRKPTPASVWYSVAESSIADEFLDWPADMFALINVILDRSEAYRFALSPPPGQVWPPSHIPGWSAAVEAAGLQWNVWIEDRTAAFPDLLAEEWRAFRERAELPLEDLAEGRDWRMCEALLTLHAIADEACAGLGVLLDAPRGKGCINNGRGRELLARTGSLSRIDTQLLRVLPKGRTPHAGTSLRSFSRYACVQLGSVGVKWHKMPVRRGGTDVRARHSNLLLLPWPLRVRESDFRPIEGSVRMRDKEPFGLFAFEPSEKLDLDLVSRLIIAAREEVDSVDVVLLPEGAIDESEVDDLEALLDSHG